MTNVSGGELAVRTLLKAGVTNIFALYGGHLEALFQACREHGLPILDVRHEASAGHAAEGFARARRTLGVAFATAGPGFTNIVTSIANASLDRTPVLYLVAATAQAHAERNMIQAGFDQVAIARPIAEGFGLHSEYVTDPTHLVSALRRALESGQPACVNVEIELAEMPPETEALIAHG